MDGFWSSFPKWFSEKTSSPLYFTYIGFFIVWNWKFFQIIFLESDKVFSRPRIEYLQFLSFQPTQYELINQSLNAFWRTVPPAVFTYIAIVWLPIVHKWAFSIYLNNYFDRKIAFQEKKSKYEEMAAQLTKQEAIAKKTQAEQKQIIEKVKTQEEKWTEEFRAIKQRHLLNQFQQLVGAIYARGGLMFAADVNGYVTNAPSVMAFAGTHDLIQVIEKKYGSSTNSFIELTDKGKYFSRLLTDEGVLAK